MAEKQRPCQFAIRYEMPKAFSIEDAETLYSPEAQQGADCEDVLISSRDRMLVFDFIQRAKSYEDAVAKARGWVEGIFPNLKFEGDERFET